MLTSSPPNRMRPEVGSSRPAIIRSVVVLPQLDWPEHDEELAILDGEARVLHGDEAGEFLAQMLGTRISAIALLRELGDDDEHQRADQHGDERV